MSFNLKDQHICSLYISRAVFLNEALELMGVGSFCVSTKYIKSGSEEGFMLLLNGKTDERKNCATKVHLCLWFCLLVTAVIFFL